MANSPDSSASQRRLISTVLGVLVSSIFLLIPVLLRKPSSPTAPDVRAPSTPEIAKAVEEGTERALTKHEADTRRQAAVDKAVSDAKKNAVAILSYASDHNWVLPPDVDFLKMNLEQEGMFHYTFKGGKIMESDTKDAKTEVGYNTGPGLGRVIIYADGHVKWHEE